MSVWEDTFVQQMYLFFEMCSLDHAIEKVYPIMIDEKARQQALWAVSYYQPLVADPKAGWGWELGLQTAQRFLQLVEQEKPNTDDVDNLIKILKANDEGTAWDEMYHFVTAWRNRLINST